MKYRFLGRTGVRVSALGFGTMSFSSEADPGVSARLFDRCLGAGINVFDCADVYAGGRAEAILGDLVTSARDQVVLMTKAYFPMGDGPNDRGLSRYHLVRAVESSLRRLKTDRIDVMLCHEGTIEDPSVYIEGFEALKEDGFVREYGISTNSLDVLRTFYETSNGVCSVVEVDYSLLNRGAEGAFLDFCAEKRLGVLVRGPLAKGILSGKYDLDTVFTDAVRGRWNRGESGREDYESLIARFEKVRAAVGDDARLVETALRFIISHDADPVVIPGATHPDQVRANAAAGRGLLDDALYRKLSALD